MGALAEGFAAYAQPLLDQTDGSYEQLNKAMVISQLCYNLSLLPEDKREASLNAMRPRLEMNDEEFAEFRRIVVMPMIERHHEMFPGMHRQEPPVRSPGGHSPRPELRTAAPTPTKTQIAPYGPCPCQSGKKYKFCCGVKRR